MVDAFLRQPQRDEQAPIRRKRDEVRDFLLKELSPREQRPSRSQIADDFIRSVASPQPAVAGANIRDQRRQEMEQGRRQQIQDAGQLYTLTNQLAQQGNMDAKAVFEFANQYDKPQEVLAALQAVPDNVGAENIFQYGPRAAAQVGATLQARADADFEKSIKLRELGLKEAAVAAKSQKVDKEEQKRRGARAAEIRKKGAREVSATSVADNISEAFQEAVVEGGFFRSGLPGYLASASKATGAGELAGTLNTIKGNIGFDKLQAMRDASPTGGALGQVSNRELEILQGVFGELSVASSKEELQENLTNFTNYYANLVYGTNNQLAQLYEEGFITDQELEKAITEKQNFFQKSFSPLQKMAQEEQKEPASGPIRPKGFRIVE